MKKLSIQMMDPNKLIPYVNNAKIHSSEQILKIASLISEFGFDQPIVVDKNHVIIKGHGRREASIVLELAEVPVVVADHLDDHQVKAARLSDNKVSSNDYDLDLLKIDLGSLQAADFDLSKTAISDFELEGLMSELNVGNDLGGVIGDLPTVGGDTSSEDQDDKSEPSETKDEKPDEAFTPKRWSFTLVFETQAQFTAAVKVLKENDEDLAKGLLKVIGYEDEQETEGEDESEAAE